MHIKNSGEFIGWCGLKFLPDKDEIVTSNPIGAPSDFGGQTK